MSVRTTADERIEHAEESILEAIRALNAVIIDRCNGYDDLRNETKSNLRKACSMLMDARELLEP